MAYMCLPYPSPTHTHMHTIDRDLRDGAAHICQRARPGRRDAPGKGRDIGSNGPACAERCQHDAHAKARGACRGLRACGVPSSFLFALSPAPYFPQAQGRDVVLEVGHTVLGRVLRLTSKQAHVEVLAVGEQALRQACQGIIKKEDVRQHDVRAAAPFSCSTMGTTGSR